MKDSDTRMFKILTMFKYILMNIYIYTYIYIYLFIFEVERDRA